MSSFIGTLSHHGSESDVSGHIQKSDPKRPDSWVGDFSTSTPLAFRSNDRPILTVREGEISGFKMPISVQRTINADGKGPFRFHSSGKGKPLLTDSRSPEGRGVEGT
jgi:hypothetical protein